MEALVLLAVLCLSSFILLRLPHLFRALQSYQFRPCQSSSIRLTVGLFPPPGLLWQGIRAINFKQLRTGHIEALAFRR
jgi:hypothetical protein